MEKIHGFLQDLEDPQKPSVPHRVNILNPLPHLKTLYLLVASDLKTTLLPASIFALVTALSGSLLTTYVPTYPLTSHDGHHQNHGGHNHMPSSPLPLSTLLPDMAKSIVWTLLSLLLFNLANQRLPNSILEDKLNKPYRCIPSGRLTPTGARHLLLFVLPVVILLTHFVLGGRNEALFLIALTWVYNDLGAGDEHFLIRHIINALGFITFGAGAASVGIGAKRELNHDAHQWLALIAIIITFTIQYQDMEDQEGDAARDRKTMPLVLGDQWTRRINAGVICVFSAICPWWWGLRWWGYGITALLGGWIACRSILGDISVKRDKVTFRLWCLWLVGLYLLPLGRGEGVLEGLF